MLSINQYSEVVITISILKLNPQLRPVCDSAICIKLTHWNANSYKSIPKYHYQSGPDFSTFPEISYAIVSRHCAIISTDCRTCLQWTRESQNIIQFERIKNDIYIQQPKCSLIGAVSQIFQIQKE